MDREDLHHAHTQRQKHKAQRIGWAKYLIYWLRGQDLNR